MEFFVLKYFLAVAKEQNFSSAANSLHISQPTLSRQIKNLEDEIGKPLFIRGPRKITLTEDGMILKKRAQEILNLIDLTEKELSFSDSNISGDIYIGCCESKAVQWLIRAGMELRMQYPDIHIHTISGDASDIIDRLNKGVFDFAILLEPVDLTDYDFIELPYRDVLGLLLPRDCELAQKDSITPSDLLDIPLINSRQQLVNPALTQLMNSNKLDNLNIVGTYNLLYNASIMVKEGMGYALCIDGIIDTGNNSTLVFRPITPTTEIKMTFVWKKYQSFTKASKLFLDKVKDYCTKKEEF